MLRTILTGTRLVGLAAALTFVGLASGCHGSIDDPGAAPFGAKGPVGTAGTSGSSDNPGGAGSGSSAGKADVNRIPIHRLNNTEYDNTMHDLLGVDATPAKSFIEDEKLFGFDDIASAFGMTDAQYEQYFNAADSLVDATFADATLKQRILVCTPANASDAGCAKQIITAFGLHAFRRPLENDEVTRLLQLHASAVSQGEDFNGGIALVVKAMLSSAQFLYRVELDSDPTSLEAHALNGYELASRLSYLLWSTMPDQALLAAADSGKLLETAELTKQTERLLSDPRSKAFVSSFAGQWLGLRDLQSHQVEPSIYPAWNEDLRAAMIQEGLSYFDEFLSGSRGMDEFFTADVNFVDGPLAKLYGIDGVTGDSEQRVTNSSDERRGFMGLASFLTLTSFSYRTAPTLRGKWVLENLLCQQIAPPPPNIPRLDDQSASSAALQSENVRIRLEAHRQNPACATCHSVLDPIGLGLENYDAIGAHRNKYANGDAIDASGELPDGTEFSGLTQLSQALSSDDRLTDCVSKKLMTYALSREIVTSDAPYLDAIRQSWRNDGLGLADLVKQIVLSDPFRNRRGEAK